MWGRLWKAMGRQGEQNPLAANSNQGAEQNPAPAKMEKWPQWLTGVRQGTWQRWQGLEGQRDGLPSPQEGHLSLEKVHLISDTSVLDLKP